MDDITDAPTASTNNEAQNRLFGWTTIALHFLNILYVWMLQSVFHMQKHKYRSACSFVF